MTPLTDPNVLNGGGASSIIKRDCAPARPRLPKNDPQAAELKRLGVHFGRAHWGEGTPEISMASEYTTRVSGGFRQAGKNVVLSRAVLPVGTADQGALDRRRVKASFVGSDANSKWTTPFGPQ